MNRGMVAEQKRKSKNSLRLIESVGSWILLLRCDIYGFGSTFIVTLIDNIIVFASLTPTKPAALQ